MHLQQSSSATECKYGRKLLDVTRDTMQLIKQPLSIAGICGGGPSVGASHMHLQIHSPSSSTWKRRKRIFLWSILLVQFGFILCFWFMQLGLSERLKENSLAGEGDNKDEKRINFIKPEKIQTESKAISRKGQEVFQWLSRDLKFQQDFVLQQNNYNLSEAEKLMFGSESSVWCFKEGTINNTREIREEDFNQWSDMCHCLPDWHGQDCGQPEVIWRALMTAKITIKLQNPTEDEAHRLVYMIEGPFFNIDLFELQIQAVIKVVDYFIIYYTRNSTTSPKDLKNLKYRLRQMLPQRNYILYHCKFPSFNINCSSAEAYRVFRQQQLLTNAIKPTDLFIYTDNTVILGHRALNFLKYYSSIIPIVQFRLKFNVYGFYWQHPQLTKLKGIISNFQHVDSINADPALLEKSLTSSSLVIGDLNHFGGWFCKYCQEPDEIINELQFSTMLANITITPSSIKFPMDKKHSSLHIDNAYIQQLISLGLNLNDGKTQLLKVYRSSDKYYAPRYASKESWKYGHLLVNIYETLDEDNEEEMF